MSGLWKTWITAWCGFVMVFGAALTLVALPATDALPRWIFAVISQNPASDALLAQPAMRFGFGLQGALTIGLALTFLGMARAAETGGAPVWRSMTLALTTWFVLDSGISVITGFPLNAVSNALVMAGYLIPVLASRALVSR